jgi:RNA polymerase sigma-70 factor (ECF subfamily)
VPAEPSKSGPREAEERALMAAYAGGDEQAFAALFRVLAPRILGFFRRTISDPTLAEDLLQITFVRIHAARARYRPELPLRPWAFTIAARVRIDELRRLHRLPPFASEEELDRLEARAELERGAGASDDDVQLQRLRSALAALAPAQRMIVHLHRFEELSFAEIGRVLGVSEGAARVRAFRAYARLREQLASALEEPSS